MEIRKFEFVAKTKFLCITFIFLKCPSFVFVSISWIFAENVVDFLSF